MQKPTINSSTTNSTTTSNELNSIEEQIVQLSARRKNLINQQGETAFVRGAKSAATTIGYTAVEAIPWKFWQPEKWVYSAGFLAMGLGIFALSGMVWNTVRGGVSGIASNKPLPMSAPGEMKAGFVVTNTIKNIGGGVASGIDTANRVQLASSNPENSLKVPTRIGTPAMPYTMTNNNVPVVEYQGQ